MRSHYVVQASLKLLASSDPPILASQSAGITARQWRPEEVKPPVLELSLALLPRLEGSGMILTHYNLHLLGSIAGITGMHHHTWQIFVFLVEMGFHHVGQDGLDLLTSDDPPALASKKKERGGRKKGKEKTKKAVAWLSFSDLTNAEPSTPKSDPGVSIYSSWADNLVKALCTGVQKGNEARPPPGGPGPPPPRPGPPPPPPPPPPQELSEYRYRDGVMKADVLPCWLSHEDHKCGHKP
ncbi:hypothetical protein AAY473_005672, partial [Plecturocebus cupreus]